MILERRRSSFRFNFDFESKVDDLGVNVHLDKLEFKTRA
jgi:hypothetical protein